MTALRRRQIGEPIAIGIWVANNRQNNTLKPTSRWTARRLGWCQAARPAGQPLHWAWGSDVIRAGVAEPGAPIVRRAPASLAPRRKLDLRQPGHRSDRPGGESPGSPDRAHDYAGPIYPSAVPTKQESRCVGCMTCAETGPSAPMPRSERAAWGRIGGLTTSARHGGQAMTLPARRGFRERFEREVDPEGRLEPGERVRRAERAMRAHMLRLAQASAEARAKRPSPRVAPRGRPRSHRRVWSQSRTATSGRPDT